MSGINSAQARNAEIFFGNDHGVGTTGSLYAVDEGTNDLQIPTAGLDPGAYLLSVRVQDDKGAWTPTVSRMIYICSPEGLQGAEYFVDTDPGPGRGTSIAGFRGSVCEFALPTAGLATGLHTLTVRTLGLSGEWDGGISRTFLVTGDNAGIEWFFDQDPGVGNGNRVDAESGSNVIMLPTATLSPGAHILSFRVRDTKGRWTPTTTRTVYVAEPAEGITAGEYFVDQDPGEGNATAFALDHSGAASFAVPTDALGSGLHYLTLRGKTVAGSWTLLHVAPFEVKKETGIGQIEWKMGFAVRREGSVITLTGSDIPSGSSVEVVTVSGLTLHHGTWEDGQLPYTIDTSATHHNLILVITAPGGITTVRRIH